MVHLTTMLLAAHTLPCNSFGVFKIHKVPASVFTIGVTNRNTNLPEITKQTLFLIPMTQMDAPAKIAEIKILLL